MKKIINICLSACAVLLMTVQMHFLTSCNDDLAADSYYTFTGEMMSDFLQNNEDFSLFRRIVEKAGRMDFMASRGDRTFFPAVNSAVEQYLAEQGYASVEDIPVEICDTLVLACLIDNAVRYTYNFSATVQETNELDLPLIIETTGDTLDANGMALSIINSRAAIINELKNDSVENGVVHPVDRVLIPNTSVGAALLDQNHSEFTIFYEALSRTQLLDSIRNYRDDDYEAWKGNYPEFRTGIRSGGIFSASDQGYEYHAKRPDHRYSGYTLLIVPDKVLYEKYSDRFNEGMTLDEKVEALYQLAADLYGDEESIRIFGLDKTVPTDAEGRTYKDLYWNMESLTNRHNPLNMFLSYHILDRLFTSTAKLINCWGTNTRYANPTEWISTLLDYSTIKLERVYETIDQQVESAGGYYVNHSTASRYNDYQRVRGAILTTPGTSTQNFTLNTSYFYLDDVVAYDATMRTNVMNTRMRIDFVTLWPELTNNDIRLCGDPALQPYYIPAVDNTENGGMSNGFNYYIPPGYLKGASINENTTFFVQRPKLQWWNWGGDEINILGSSYDVEFNLPDVPPGSYELRIGYPGMMDRGIAQIYVDGVAQGIPIDMRYQASDSRVGGLYNSANLSGGFRNSEESNEGVYTTEQLEENERTMKNNGYYSGPKACFTDNDGTDAPRYSPSSCTMMYNNHYTFRRRICTVNVGYHTKHTVRIRSVFSSTNIGCFVLDYMELVPTNICGAGGLGEDLY